MSEDEEAQTKTQNLLPKSFTKTLKERIREVFKHDNWTEHLTERQMTQTEVALRTIDDAVEGLVDALQKRIDKAYEEKNKLSPYAPDHSFWLGFIDANEKVLVLLEAKK